MNGRIIIYKRKRQVYFSKMEMLTDMSISISKHIFLQEEADK